MSDVHCHSHQRVVFETAGGFCPSETSANNCKRLSLCMCTCLQASEGASILLVSAVLGLPLSWHICMHRFLFCISVLVTDRKGGIYMLNHTLAD